MVIGAGNHSALLTAKSDSWAVIEIEHSEWLPFNGAIIAVLAVHRVVRCSRAARGIEDLLSLPNILFYEHAKTSKC
jgi:hypothetical protein